MRGTARLTPYTVLWLSMFYRMHGCPLWPRQSILCVNTWVFEEVRCPFDLRRKDVQVTPWYPLAIRDVPFSATFGFHQAMYGVFNLANSCSARVLPMLCDITVHYSYLTMLYITRMQPISLCHVYGSVCSVFGIHISTLLITRTMLSIHPWWHLNTKGSFKTQRQDNCMHVLALLSRSVLFWRFTSPY